MIGKTLDGRYRIDRILGEGGMGAVYEATHVGTGRRVAVKVIQQIALGDTDVFARFQREARASSSVDTRHIVEVLDSGRDPESGLPFMAMEKLKGEDLGAHITRRGAMPRSLALRVVAQACIGLGKAHHADVVHRDIKPANLFLTEEEDDEVVVKILDFGIAKVRPKSALEGEGLALTQTGRLLGTPLYMSPEQAQGMKDIDHRTDIWSLGAVLFEALTSQPPFDVENLGKLILAICSKPVRLPSSVVPGIPPEIDAIVCRAMKIERDERYASADELLDDLLVHLPDGYGIALHELNGADRPTAPLRRTAGSGRRVPSVGASDRASKPTSSVRVTPPTKPPADLVETRAADEEVGVASTLYASVGAMPSPQRRRRRLGAAIAALVLASGAAGLWLRARAPSEAAGGGPGSTTARATGAATVIEPSAAAPATTSPPVPSDAATAASPPPSSAATPSASTSAQPRAASLHVDGSAKRVAPSSAAPAPAASILYENSFQ